MEKISGFCSDRNTSAQIDAAMLNQAWKETKPQNIASGKQAAH